MPSGANLRIISTCPESVTSKPGDYMARVIETARWCEQAGHEALLIHSDHRLVDPWVVAQVILQSTDKLRPVVTVQPLHMHPYAVAKKVVSLSQLFDRRVDLNLVAGAAKGDLLALDDHSSHDLRYQRLTEYGTVIRGLLESTEPLVHEGEFYRLHMPTPLSSPAIARRPRMFVAGSSDAGRTAARQLQAETVGHLVPETTPSACVRLGIVARADAHEAWEVARQRFHADPEARTRHRLELCWSDSCWQRALEAIVNSNEPEPTPWVGPFESRRSQCAYLVGDHRTVARHIAKLLAQGTRTFVLDTPASQEDLEHADVVFRRAWSRHASPIAACG